MSHTLHSQNGIFRVLRIYLRPKGGEWKQIRGDEHLQDLRPGVRYELKVEHPAAIGLGIEGEPILTEDVHLPLHD